jgi:hypothetical protein
MPASAPVSPLVEGFHDLFHPVTRRLHQLRVTDAG